MSQVDNIYIYQIFYDEVTKQCLDPGFIPLDNIKNERPDWYEFWPILNYLNSSQLDSNAWYGFFSPRFGEKTGLTSKVIRDFIANNKNSDVVLISYAWDQLAYFKNPFEQGEYWHPGLIDLSQEFFNYINININLKQLVTSSYSSVFSNFIIAKPKFWSRWRLLANLFFQFVEKAIDSDINATTSYFIKEKQVPMKTFIQERFSSVILSDDEFNVALFDSSYSDPVFEYLFDNDYLTRKKLQACDFLKLQYNLSDDMDYLDMYHKVRQSIRLKP